jgi:subtilisin family serine protease
MRMFRISASLALVVALMAGVTPLVAGGAKAESEVDIQRLGQGAELETRMIGSDDRSAAVSRNDGQSLVQTLAEKSPVQTQPEYVEGEVIVRYREPSALTSSVQSSVHGRAGGTPAEEIGGDSDMQLVELDDGVSVEDGVDAYEAQPEVEWAQPNYLYQIAATPGDTMFGWLDGQHNVGQTGGTTDADIDSPGAWDTETGDASVTVAVIDTGVDKNHPDLATNIWSNPGEIPNNATDDDFNGYVDDTYGWDFIGDDNEPQDDHSHGTHVAGTIGAVGNDGRGVAGVAWDVSIMAIKAFNQFGSAASSSDLVDAIDYAGDNGADVINASWGDYGPYDNAIRSAIASSPALFVAAAGNNALNTDTHPFYPAAYDLDNILAVAATDNKDALASFSNYGTTAVDVAAPGVNTLSTVPQLTYSGQSLGDSGWGDIFFDPFPTAGGWSTADYNSKPWKISSAKPGSFSGVPSIANQYYSANEEAYLDLRYPVDLSVSSAAGILFDLAASLEPGYDFLVPIASTNGGADWSPIENVAYTGSTASVERLADNDRFTTAVKIAREGYDPSGNKTWPGVDTVIVASGDDRAAADPLSAAGLCWAYDAPLFLVSGSFTPVKVKAAIKEIAARNSGAVKVVVVGGPVSVPDARYNEIASYVGKSQVSKRRVAGSDRYATAAAIAREMRSVKGATDKVLVANGADSTKFFDALALSPIAARNGYPIIPVSATSVPSASRSILSEIGPAEVIIGGGPATVKSGAKNSIKSITGVWPQQWYGPDRYYTATTIASKAVSRGFLSDQAVGVAAKLPDALTGGSMIGAKKNGVLLITQSDRLTPTTSSWVSAHSANIANAYVFGGTKSVFTTVQDRLTGLVAVWVTEYLDLGDYLGQPAVQIAFVLVSDADTNYDGVFIDDVEILSFGGYGLNSGTSMAAPHTAGVAALLTAADPSLSTTETKQAIIDTVDAKSGLSGKVGTGGRINANSAVGAVP